jgi:tetratricopeptide (TPR) repeat protein
MRKTQRPQQILPILVLFMSCLFSYDLAAQEQLPLSDRQSGNQQEVEYEILFSKALLYINQSRYSEAVQKLNQLATARPQDVEVSYYLGMALSKTGQDEEAEKILSRVVSLNPQFQKAHFDLGVAKFNLGKYREALQEFELAERAEPNRALVYYYEGLTLYRLGEYERSSSRFLRAAQLAPDLGLTAHYYAGVGYYRQGIMEQARPELQRAIRIDPASPVGRSAQEFLAQIERARERAKPWSFNFSTAYQYDTNVVLLPGGTPPPVGISKKGDSRQVVYASAGYMPIRTSTWSVDTHFNFYQSLHQDLTSFNVRNYSSTTSFKYWRGRMQIQIPYEFNYAFVDEDGFLSSHAVIPTLTIQESSITSTEIRYGYQSKNFMNTTQFSNNDDRDGVNHAITVAQSIDIGETGLLKIGYSYDRDLTGNTVNQDDWQYQGHRIFGNLKLATFLNMKLDLKAEYSFQDYQHPVLSAGEERSDNAHTYALALSKNLGRWAALTAQYLFNQNSSSIGSFNYNRHIYSLIVAGAF